MDGKLQRVLKGMMDFMKDRTRLRFMKLLDKIYPDKKDEIVKLINEDKIDEAVKLIIECVMRD